MVDSIKVTGKLFSLPFFAKALVYLSKNLGDIIPSFHKAL